MLGDGPTVRARPALDDHHGADITSAGALGKNAGVAKQQCLRIVVGNFERPAFRPDIGCDSPAEGRRNLALPLGCTGGGEFIEQFGALLAADGRFGITRSGKPQPFAAEGDVDVLGKTMDDFPDLRQRGSIL